MKKTFKKQSGITIIELIVAMSIFLVVITIAVGGFVSLIRLQGQSESMTDVQQNGRIVIEQMTRLARQAESIEITHLDPLHADHGSSGENYLDQIKITTGKIVKTTACFRVDSGRLKKYDNCAGDGLTLSSDDVVVTRFYFEKTDGVPATLKINISVNSTGTGVNEDELNLNTSVLLTGLK